MKKADITNKKDADLRKEMNKLREELRTGRAGLNQDEATLAPREARKMIARIQTELSKRAKETEA